MQSILDLPTLIGIVIAFIHFGIPIIYFVYIKKFYDKDCYSKYSDNPKFIPMVSIIVPTYNESEFIEEKLDNIYGQDYPRDKLEVIIVDSGSKDGTPKKVLDWIKKHKDIVVRLIREPIRRGKAHALNNALKNTSGDIVIITDADAKWVSNNTLRKVVKYFNDPSIGAVSCNKLPEAGGPRGLEASYRSFYNILRVGESNLYSTPIFHGELAAFLKKLLNGIGGFPTDIGADDSHTATLIALKGYRAIIPKDITCTEAVPLRDYRSWRIRRAQHLVQHFWKSLRIKTKVPKQFRLILYIETYLHLINPWLLLIVLALLAISALMETLLALIILLLGIALLVNKAYRTWIITQLYLIIATIRNLWTRELIWKKQPK